MASKKKASKKGASKRKPRGASTSVLDPRSSDGFLIGSVANLTMFGGDVIAAQTNLVIQACQAPCDLIPLSFQLCNRATAGGTPTGGLYNNTDAADVFANANFGATGVASVNTTQGQTLVQKGEVLQLRVTTGGGVTATGVQGILTYVVAGAPANRTL